MSVPSVRKINQRRILRAHPDNEAATAVHYTDDGIILIRPASRFCVPWEDVPLLIDALREGRRLEPK